MKMNESQQAEKIAANWAAVQSEVEAAANSAGRSNDTIKVVGVSKYVSCKQTRMLVEAGCNLLGESRPQVLWSKAEADSFLETVQWHLIGHLQRNKIRRLLRHPVVIESIDSVRVLDAVAEESTQLGLTTTVLLEVNISGDQKKTGFTTDELPRVMEQLPDKGVNIVGLMAMAGWGTDPLEARRQFEETRLLRDQLQQDSGHPLPELSMGMSGDFPAAIAEGATIVRIGSRLFEGIERESP